jgi:hypothetical protein
MKQVQFIHSAALATASAVPRPEGSLVLRGVHGHHDYAFGLVLVDSGADFVVLPEKAGLHAGLALPPKPTTSLAGVGGRVGAALMKAVALEFQGAAIVADVLFDYSNTVPPLFGRSGLRALRDVGIDPSSWHWTP